MDVGKAPTGAVAAVDQAKPEHRLAKRLQAARKAAGLSQQQLCHQANLSLSTLAKIERGAIKSPSVFTVQAIAGAVGTTIEDLLGNGAGGGRRLAKTKSGVSFIYFDVHGCLAAFQPQVFQRIAEDYGLPIDMVEMAYLHYNDDAGRGVLTMADFNSATAKRLGIESLDWAKYIMEAVESIASLHEVVRWATEHYRIGLLTNILPGLLDKYRAVGIVPDLPYDVIIDSSQVGTIKPETKIFEVAAERAGVAPAEIMLVDDSVGDLVAAEKQGWHVLRFDFINREESAASVRAALEPAA